MYSNEFFLTIYAKGRPSKKRRNEPTIFFGKKQKVSAIAQQSVDEIILQKT